jgi:ubiquinone/menaquinone biosynthesis C-methylase UbiE
MLPVFEKMSEEEVSYNNSLFEKLLPIYDTAALVLTPVRRAIPELLHLPTGTHVVDVACGTGTQAKLLAEHGYRVTGIDLSPAMLKQAEEKMGELDVKFICCDAARTGCANHCFDAAIISFSLHDMPPELRMGVLKEMRRITKAGGVILVADYALPAESLLAALEKPISNLFESKYFPSFMETGIEYYLKQVGLKTEEKISVLGGIGEVVRCTN